MEFSRQVYWSGLPCPLPGDLSDLGIEPESLMSEVRRLREARKSQLQREQQLQARGRVLEEERAGLEQRLREQQQAQERCQRLREDWERHKSPLFTDKELSPREGEEVPCRPRSHLQGLPQPLQGFLPSAASEGHRQLLHHLWSAPV